MPEWLRIGWWVSHGERAGGRWAIDHPKGASWFGAMCCLVVSALVVTEAIWRWHGARSAIPFTVGVALGVALVGSYGRTLRSADFKRAAGLGAACNLLGALAVVPTVVLAGEKPGNGLGITQALADGYIAAMFAVILLHVRFLSRHDRGHLT